MAKATNRRHLEAALNEAERALESLRAELAASQKENRDLAARMRELEGELERRPPETDAGEEISLASGDDGTLRDALSREWQLARRVAELEASRAMEPAPTEASEEHQALMERIETLTLQLDAARAREDELAVRAIRAERTLAETGARLAELGLRADEAEGLEAALTELREATGQAAEEAREREADLRAQLDEALVRATGLEADLAASVEATEQAVLAADDAMARADLAEDRLRATGLELAAATEVLRHLEEVFAAVRDRVDATADDIVDLGPDASPPEEEAMRVSGAPEPTAEEDRAFVAQLLQVGDITEIADLEYGPGAPADLAALGEIVLTPGALDELGEPLFPGIHVKAAALFSELIRRRPYLQGNRRIALLATVRFLDLNGYDVVGGEDALAELALAIEAGEVPLLSIAATLEALTVRRNADPHAPMQDAG